MTSPTPGTAVAAPSAAAVAKTDPRVADAKARTALITALRGTQWGRECDPNTLRAVAAYVRQNGLDARHVEVLGGRIYLTAEFYDERGAPLILDGTIKPQEPQFINVDPRLDEIIKANADEESVKWAKGEKWRRLQQRIEHNVPEDAKAAVVHRFVLKSGSIIPGVNWCGSPSATKKDPVGNAEPTKTALTRARRRAWRQIALTLPDYGAQILPIEANAKLALAETAEFTEIEAPSDAKQLSSGEVAPAVEDVKEPLVAEREPGQEG